MKFKMKMKRNLIYYIDMKKLFFLSLAIINLLVFNSCQNNSFLPHKVNLILDTDFGPDYDDVGAIAVMHALSDSAKVNILATIASTKYNNVAAALNVFNTYVWPSCHHDKRFGDMLWPDQTGEWEIIKKGNARFAGHYQPKVPLWGYEPDDDPKVMERWIEAATAHGVNTFIFDWYWFDEGPFLESSLNNGFLKANNRDKMNFYLMWANHDVKRNYWNVHKFKDDESLLWDGAVDLKNFEIIVDRVIKSYFSQPNYYKIDGIPVFSIFSLTNLLEGLGGLEKAAIALDYFREKTKEAGFPGLHLQLIIYGQPNQESIKIHETLKINSLTQYNWGWMQEQDYIKWATKAIGIRSDWKTKQRLPFFTNVSIGWDASYLFKGKPVDENLMLYGLRNKKS
jgi:hypothetical protein